MLESMHGGWTSYVMEKELHIYTNYSAPVSVGKKKSDITFFDIWPEN